MVNGTVGTVRRLSGAPCPAASHPDRYASVTTNISVESKMPEISRFLGIVIAMFYRDHAPAHFHAMYGDYEITVTIETGVVTGRFPRRALRHVLEWYELHKDDLLEDWEFAQARRPLKKIAPLE